MQVHYVVVSDVISFMFHNGAIYIYTQHNMFLFNICDSIIIYIVNAVSVIPLHIIVTFLCCVWYYKCSVIPNVYYRLMDTIEGSLVNYWRTRNIQNTFCQNILDIYWGKI